MLLYTGTTGLLGSRYIKLGTETIELLSRSFADECQIYNNI